MNIDISHKILVLFMTLKIPLRIEKMLKVSPVKDREADVTKVKSLWISIGF